MTYLNEVKRRQKSPVGNITELVFDDAPNLVEAVEKLTAMCRAYEARYSEMLFGDEPTTALPFFDLPEWVQEILGR